MNSISKNQHLLDIELEKLNLIYTVMELLIFFAEAAILISIFV